MAKGKRRSSKRNSTKSVKPKTKKKQVESVLPEREFKFTSCCCMDSTVAKLQYKPKTCPMHFAMDIVDLSERERMTQEHQRRENYRPRVGPLQPPTATEIRAVPETKMSPTNCQNLIEQYTKLLHKKQNVTWNVESVHDVYSRRACLYIAMGCYKSALLDVQHALRAKPTSAVAHFQIGQILFLHHRFAESAETFLLGLKMHPSCRQLQIGFDRAQARLKVNE